MEGYLRPSWHASDTLAAPHRSGPRPHRRTSVRDLDAVGRLEGALLRINADVDWGQVAHRHELHPLRPDLDAVPDTRVLAAEPERAGAKRVPGLAEARGARAAAHEPRLLTGRVEVQVGVVGLRRHLVLGEDEL